MGKLRHVAQPQTIKKYIYKNIKMIRCISLVAQPQTIKN